MNTIALIDTRTEVRRNPKRGYGPGGTGFNLHATSTSQAPKTSLRQKRKITVRAKIAASMLNFRFAPSLKKRGYPNYRPPHKNAPTVFLANIFLGKSSFWTRNGLFASKPG
jgi:hypothetical protein